MGAAYQVSGASVAGTVARNKAAETQVEIVIMTIISSFVAPEC